MSKIWIVLKSEFLRRVQSKWFIISTILAPVLLIAVAVIPGVLAVVASEGDDRTIAVVDETNLLFSRLSSNEESNHFVEVNEPVDSLRAAIKNGHYDGYLVLPQEILNGQGTVTYYSVEGGGLSLRRRIEQAVNQVIEEYRLAEKNVDPEILQILESRVPVRMVKITEAGETADSAVAYTLVGYIMGFFIYMAMFIYGAFVMHGVMEEKTTRVVEIMVSSVRPFDLMMGKVLGIGAMGLVQMILWSLLILAGLTFAGTIVSLFVDPASLNLPENASQEEILTAIDFSAPGISPMLFVWFVLFFLGGYLLYASLFAAIGSAVEQQSDAQSLTLPVTMLIIVPIIFMSFLIESPNSTLSIILSMIPFFSPILMVVRVAITDVPLWQSGLAFVLLVATFIGAIWISARIYRVGILMYGKKPGFRDLARWFRYA